MSDEMSQDAVSGITKCQRALRGPSRPRHATAGALDVSGEISGACRRELVLRLEVQNVGDRHTIEMTADFPGRKNFRIDKLVDGFPAKLPAMA